MARQEPDWRFVSTLSQYTLPQVLAKQAERYGSTGTAIRKKSFGVWEALSWEEYLEYTKGVALGLLSLGIQRGERVGIITGNEPEWLFSELGAQAVGAETVNLFSTATTNELGPSLNRIGAAFAIVQDQEQVDKLIEVRGDLSHIRKVIYIDRTGMRTYGDDPWLLSFHELLERGKDFARSEGEDCFDRELWKGKPDDVAIMTLTSGTTGRPKLAMLSHLNFTAMASKWIEATSLFPGDNWISIGPPAWIVDQFFGIGVTLSAGMTINFPETEETVFDDFREVGPTFLIMPSRFWEDLASRIRVKISDSGGIKRALFRLSARIGNAVIDRRSNNNSVPVSLQALNWLASAVIYQPLLDRVGCSQSKAALTGGHPISPDVIRFFRSKGLNLKQCYGLTESGGIFQVQPDDEVKLETVGKPLPGVRVSIAEDQEVLVESDANFVGYYGDIEATNKALVDGWLHTGDAGWIDDDGHLLIIGRKQDIMRTEQGDAFSPDFIETRLKFSPYIKEAVIFGEDRPYVSALINIDMGNVGSWAEDRMIPYTTYTDLSQQRAVEELILDEVRQVNLQLPEPMRVKRMILLYKLLDADDEELTRTGKVRRRFVHDQYRSLIEAMYSSKTQMDVEGRIQYRDGRVGTIETTVRILSLEEVSR